MTITFLLYDLKLNFLIFTNSLHSSLIFTRDSKIAMAWASVRLSVRLSVTLLYCVKTVIARITKFLLWAVTLTLVYRNKISCPWMRGFSSNEGVKKGYPLKNVILLLLACIVLKRLQISTDMLLIITSTKDRSFRFVNIDNLERP